MASATDSAAAADIGTLATEVVAARCAPQRVLLLEPAAARSELEVGDSVIAPDGPAVSLVHGSDRGAVAAVGFVDVGAARVQVVDLGPTLGDAPPPRLAVRSSTLLAAAYKRGSARPESCKGASCPDAGSEAREVVLYAVAPRGPAVPLLSLFQQRDDSFALDLATADRAQDRAGEHAQDRAQDREGALVVWDEANGAARGVIRGAPIFAGDRPGPARDLSPPESDAELPRIVAMPVGYIVMWIARRAEPSASGVADSAEAPGEPRSFGWVEAVAVDEHASPFGPIRRLTPPTGHVDAFDVQRLGASVDASVLVVARDEGEAVDASGGALLRVRLTSEGADAPLAYPGDGLGRGAPALVAGGEGSLLAFTGPREQMRLLPLDSAGSPSGPPSAEDAMGDGKPLLVLGRIQGGPAARVLAAAPVDRGASLRLDVCRDVSPLP